MANNSAKEVLSGIDYAVFIGMLAISALIGVFYAYRDRKSKDGTRGYLMANRSMGVFPVALSIGVSFQSAVTVLGIPADVYQFGMMYIWLVLSLVLVTIIVSTAFIPTLYNLGISSTYEYLEKRYSKSMRLITTGTFIVQYFLFLGVNIYGPSLALRGVTGLSSISAMLSTGLICTLYTTLGGLKGVIWTDVLQGAFMMVGMLTFIIRGCFVMGGITEVWNIAEAGGRTDILKFDLDPRKRYTVWTVAVGSFIIWIGILGTNQAQVQRYLSVKSENKAKKSLYLGVTVVSMFATLAVLCGLVCYAYYHQCDPILTNCIDKRDQLMPYAVMDLFRDMPGVPGLFLACVFSASLSTVSSGLNAMVTVTIEDFVKPHTRWSERRYTWFSKGLGVAYGCITLGISFLASVLGDIASIGIASLSAFLGPSVGIFILGLWFPFVNSTGAIFGFTSGIIATVTLFFGGRNLKKPNSLVGMLDVGLSNCPNDCGYMTFNNQSYVHGIAQTTEASYFYRDTSTTSEPEIEFTAMENFFAISYFYTASVGLAVCLVIGIITSLLSCGWSQRHTVDIHLLRPPFEAGLFSWIPDKIRSYLRCGIYWEDRKKQPRGIYSVGGEESKDEIHADKV
uniref:sodium-coupled monocarboxylate transporter 1-like n=1 Tax=Styela clava TaxID=7725 RepID=UPI00193AB3B1|nr:sodium-coupled monocarboxylate transporter 1-like [Styela clava]